VFLCTGPATGQSDWPQWRGPNRDGHAAPQSLLQQWPEGGPRLKWQAKNIGRGYSAVAVVDGKLYTMGARDGNCYLLCLDAANGQKQWETLISDAGSGDDYSDGWGAGPRSTPTIDGDQIFVLSDVGVLAAMDRETGDPIWATDLVQNHQGEIPNWGYSESPLVDGDRVIATPGGNNFMIGVDRQSGQRVWTSKDVDAPAQYVSVMRGSVGNHAYYVTASKSGLYAFDADSGNNLFRDVSTGNTVAVVPTPILSGTFVYHTSAYGAGNTLLKLTVSDTGIDAESVYHMSGKTMENHHGGVVLLDGVIYGFTKANGGCWMAQEMESGQKLWEQRARPNKSGSLCYADGRLYCYNDKDGTVLLVQPNREEFVETGKLRLPEQTELDRGKGAIWAHPVVANQTLFIRDQDLLFAYDIAR
jgi:outer membrane protein assembly factor BamB